MDEALSAMGRRSVLVQLTDCPICLSAGSVRRGVCDICGSHAPAGRSGEDNLVPA